MFLHPLVQNCSHKRVLEDEDIHHHMDLKLKEFRWNWHYRLTGDLPSGVATAGTTKNIKLSIKNCDSQNN